MIKSVLCCAGIVHVLRLYPCCTIWTNNRWILCHQELASSSYPSAGPQPTWLLCHNKRRFCNTIIYNAIQSVWWEDISLERTFDIPKSVILVNQVCQYIFQVHFFPLSVHCTGMPAGKHSILPCPTWTPLHTRLYKVNTLLHWHLMYQRGSTPTPCFLATPYLFSNCSHSNTTVPGKNSLQATNLSNLRLWRMCFIMWGRHTLHHWGPLTLAWTHLGNLNMSCPAPELVKPLPLSIAANVISFLPTPTWQIH